MMADADLSRPADGRILKGFTWEDIDLPSLEQYRRRFMTVHPDHPWVTEDNDGLMRKLGGYRRDRESGEEGFTLAGLLMFGKFEAIKDPACAPNFSPIIRRLPPIVTAGVIVFILMAHGRPTYFSSIFGCYRSFKIRCPPPFA